MPAPVVPVFSEDDIRGVLTYDDLIPVMRAALMDFSAGRVIQPLRSVVSIPSAPGWFAVMPAAYGGVMGAKMVTFFPGNAGLGKHTHLAVIQLFRSDTGEPVATLDGRLITEMRTAATSAVAVDHLAASDANTLAILGSGVQARSHFAAISRVRPVREVRVWSRSLPHAQRFAAETGAVAVVSAERAVDGADLVVTATSSPVPVLCGKWLKPNAVVCAIGAVTPDRRELDDDAMRGPIIVESREAAEREPGDILLSHAQVTAEIGQLLLGGALDRNGSPIIFKSVGIAVEDIAAAKLACEKLTHGRRSPPP